MHTAKSSDTETSTASAAANVQRKSSDPQEERLQNKDDTVQRFPSKNNSNSGLSAIISNGTGNAIQAQNAAFSSIISSGIQPKVKVGAPDDKYEEEADSTADKVMRMSEPSGDEEEQVQTRPVRKSISRMIQQKTETKGKEEKLVQKVQLQPEGKEPVQRAVEEEETVQRKTDSSGNGAVPATVEGTLKSSKGSGQPLSSSVRNYMEPRFGSDFSDVRVHTGSGAQNMSISLNARAFTHGSDIYFNEGNYDPDSNSGRHLIAHELTHAVQQGAVADTGKTQKPGSTSQGIAARSVQRSWYGDAWNAVSGAVSGAAEWVGDNLEAGKDWLLGWLTDKVVSVPGYKLFTVVLNQDPITGDHVPRNGMNFIKAGLDIIPNGEAYQQKLKEQGTLAQAAKWLNGQLGKLSGISPSAIIKRFNNFWSGLSLTDVRHPKRVFQDLLRIFSKPINRIISFAKSVAMKFMEIVKDYLLSKVKDFIKKKQSPSFYPLLTVVLGKDPITGEEVEPTGKNILTGFMKLHPKGDKQLKKMKETGSFGKAARWINTSITRIKNIAAGLTQAFSTLWDAITDINTLMNPVSTFEKVYKKFSNPLVELASFMWTVGKKVLSFIKDALLSRLSAFARKTRGYPLITVILGQDPFTQKKIPQTAERIILGFFSLMENGRQKFKKLKESGAIARTIAWMSNAVAQLGITWDYIVGLFSAAWKSLSIDNLMQPFKAFRQIVALFTPPIQRLLNFVVKVVKKVIEIMLKIMNFPVNLIGSIFQKTAGVITLIQKDPIGFIKNLLRGVKQGFMQFFNNIGTHLMNGLTKWLFGQLGKAGIKPPPDLSLSSILGLVLEILDITKDKIFAKVAEKIGKKKMERIRGFMDKLTGIWAFVKDVVQRGPVAIWEYVKEKISNLWNMVFEQVKSWVMEKIVKKVSTKLLSMLDPSGVMAVVNSFIAIYNAIESFVEYFTKMLKMVNRFVDGVAAVATGNLAPAANKLESSLSKGMPIAIGFFANQVGLSGLGKKVGKMIEGVRKKVDSAIDWLVKKAVKAGGAILNKAKSVMGSVKDTVANIFGGKTHFKTESGEAHSLYVETVSNKPQLMMASAPKTMERFLKFYKSKNKEKLDESKTKRGHFEKAEDILKDEVNPLIEQLEKEKQKDESSEKEIKSIQQKLLDKEAKLADSLRLLLREDEDIGQMIEKYALEGITGTFGTMPKPKGDDFTADHQPQAAILEESARMSRFRVKGATKMRSRAAGRADAGYAINLHENRHEAGRTYRSKGSTTKNKFLRDVDNATSSESSPKENRVQVVGVIKSHLNADVSAMKGVISKGYKHDNWKDIYQNPGLGVEEKKEVIDDVRSRIDSGEGKLKNQDLDSLADIGVDSPLSTAEGLEEGESASKRKKVLTRLSINNPGSKAKESLQKLQGIGPSRADDIIANTPYSSWADLTQIPGITEDMVNKWKNQQNVDGDRLVYLNDITEWS